MTAESDPDWAGKGGGWGKGEALFRQAPSRRAGRSPFGFHFCKPLPHFPPTFLRGTGALEAWQLGLRTLQSPPYSLPTGTPQLLYLLPPNHCQGPLLWSGLCQGLFPQKPDPPTWRSLSDSNQFFSNLRTFSGSPYPLQTVLGSATSARHLLTTGPIPSLPWLNQSSGPMLNLPGCRRPLLCSSLLGAFSPLHWGLSRDCEVTPGVFLPPGPRWAVLV